VTREAGSRDLEAVMSKANYRFLIHVSRFRLRPPGSVQSLLSSVHKFIENHLRHRTFKDFYQSDITSVEEDIATSGIAEVFAPVILRALFWAALTLPAVVSLNTSNVALFLTPIAFVAGSAWFILSLSTIKLKFKHFAGDITKNIFESFLTSLLIMLFIALFALNTSAVTIEYTLQSNTYFKIFSAVLASIVTIRIVYLIVVGSIQYATNDAMLTGQRELMQEYFRRSLSFTYMVADLIRKEPDIKVTNYYISDAFSRIFNVAKHHLVNRAKPGFEEKVKEIEELNKDALAVLSNPERDQDEVNKTFLTLLLGFKKLLNTKNKSARKISYVEIEIDCLEKNKDSHRVIALRYATIFALIYEILQDEGEDIFL